MRLTVLGSGSSGNALLLESRGTCVFIDAGLGKRRLRERWQGLESAGRAGHEGPTQRPHPGAVFLTHEHADHACGADDLAAQGLPIYATAGTAAAARLSPRARAQVREIAAGCEISHGALRVLPVSLPHDAAEPVAYVISDGVLRVGVITDCGQPTPALAAAFAGCDALLLETNHDRGLLQAGPYPAALKRRIASSAGHLSNEQGAALLAAILAASATVPALVICAHLSKINNRPDLARRAVQDVLGRRPVRIVVAEQDVPLPPIEVTAGRRGPGQQLSLGL